MIAAVAVVAAVAGAGAPAAGAKGVARLSVCGTGGCVDRTKLALAASPYAELLLSGGTPVSADAVTAEPFVRVRIGVGDGTTRKVYGHYTAAFLPRSGHLLTEDGGWAVLQGDQLRVFRRVVRGVPRLPAARLRLKATAAAEATAAATTAAATTGATGGGDGGPPWALIAAAGGALGIAGAALAARRRRSGGDDLGTAGGAVR